MAKTKKKNNNMVHTVGKVNKHIIFFGIIAAVLNYIFLIIAAWGAYSHETVEHTKTVDEMINHTVGISIKNILLIFGVAAILLQINHVCARKESKLNFIVTVISSILLVWAIVASILMFVEI